MQLPERNSALEIKNQNLLFWELLIENFPQREFPSQNTPFHNFLTTQPIHTNSNSIDAAWRAQYDAK